MSTENKWIWRLLAIGLILAAGAGRLAFLAGECPLDLAPDEAHYWDWSRNLDWSYYSKGPLIAWIIRGGVETAGSLSMALRGDEMLAVRLPAVIFGSLMLLGVYTLTALVYGRERLAFAVVAVAQTFPLVAAGSTIMTIDSPYTCLWAWATVLGYLAIIREKKWAWPIAGLLVGLGVLAKYTMVLWLPSLGLFLFSIPRLRSQLWRPGYWAACIVAAACCMPILIWNAQHDWVTLKHTMGHAGFQGSHAESIHWLGPLHYIGTQFGILFGFWFIVWARAMWTHRPGREGRPEMSYLWWMSAPMWLIFLGFSLKNGGGEPNWPVAAYISGLVLGAGWLVNDIKQAGRFYRPFVVGSFAFFCAVGLGLSILVHNVPAIYPLLSKVVGAPSATQPTPMRRIDPTCRLMGWRTVARRVDQIRNRLEVESIDPILAAGRWDGAGLLGFYCTGHPTVYSLGFALGDRHSQYEIWRPNPVHDPGKYIGRTFIILGGSTQGLESAFDRVEPLVMVTHIENGQPVNIQAIHVCHGFRGFPKTLNAGY